MHRIHRHGSAREFLEAAESFLLVREAEYNLLLGVADALAEQERSGKPPVMSKPIHGAPLLTTVETDDGLACCAIRTPPYRLILTNGNNEAWGALATYLADADPDLPGVNGPSESAAAFSQHWVSVTGRAASRGRSMRILRLDTVSWPENPPPGTFRQAVEADRERLAEWIVALGEEIDDPQDGPSIAAARIRERNLYVWDDDGVRSMAATARRSRSGCSVNLVYTPREHRGRGYASAVVAALSDRILQSGFGHCSLYTDATNPTSNKIYEQLGYRRVGDAVEYDFDGESAPHA